MATELYDIGPDEVSLVDRGANKRRILVRKRDGDGMTEAERVEFTKQLDTLRGLAGDRLEIIKDSVDALADFENMEKVDVDAAFSAISGQLWDAWSDVVALAKRDEETDEVKLAKAMEAIAKQIGVEVKVEKATALGDRIAALRDEKELTNADLAEAAGVSESTMQGIIGGDIARPPDERLRGLARLLDVSFESLRNLIPADIRETETEVENQGDDMGDVQKVELSEEQMAAVNAVQAMLAGGDDASEEQMAMAASVLEMVSDAGGVYPKPDTVENQDGEEEIEMKKRDEDTPDIPEHVQKMLDDGKAEREELKKRLDEETDKREVAEHIAKARDWGHLGKAEDAGPILKRIHGAVTDDDWTWLTKHFDAVEAVTEQAAIFKELGAEGDGDGDDSADAKITKIAKGIMEQDGSISFAKAYSMAVENNPELYAEYRRDLEG